MDYTTIFTPLLLEILTKNLVVIWDVLETLTPSIAFRMIVFFFGLVGLVVTLHLILGIFLSSIRTLIKVAVWSFIVSIIAIGVFHIYKQLDQDGLLSDLNDKLKKL